MINNRQAGRRRGRGGGNGQRQGGGGGGMQGNGSRIDNRARGNATQLFEKYKNMAADAQRMGDRVNTEYYLQFADHYFRVLSEQRGRFEDQQQPRRPRDDFDYEGDDEFGEEGEPIRAGEQGDGARGNGDERPREFRSNRDNGDARADTRQEGGRQDVGRQDVGRQDGARQDGGRREWRDRDDRGPRRNGDYREQRAVDPEVVAGQRRSEPIAAGESLEHRAEEVLEADRPLDPPARRRGRPPRDLARDVGNGPEASGLEADRLPPALTVPANDEGEVAPRPRRARRPVDDTPSAAE